MTDVPQDPRTEAGAKAVQSFLDAHLFDLGDCKEIARVVLAAADSVVSQPAPDEQKLDYWIKRALAAETVQNRGLGGAEDLALRNAILTIVHEHRLVPARGEMLAAAIEHAASLLDAAHPKEPAE